jgi:hypothetical protein
MFDLLAVIAADPLSASALAILLLAGGMYPLGFMLGSDCSPCCTQCRSDSCEGFDLEEAFSCRRGGTTFCTEYTQEPDLLSLSFGTTCFGENAAGTVQGRGEDLGAGPLISATVTNGGSGYAELGRESPSLSLGNSSTTAAVVTINYTQSHDDCGRDLWAISSISITSGGDGYVDGQSLSITADSGDTVVAAVSGTIHTVGSGVLNSITINSGGQYYRENPDIAPYINAPEVTVNQVQPSVWNHYGSGAVITAVVDDDTASDTFGQVISLSIDNAGDYYLAWRYAGTFHYMGDGKFAFGKSDPVEFGYLSYDWQGPSRGEWVAGDGIAFGTKVLDGDFEVLKDWTLGENCLAESNRTYTSRYVLTVDPIPEGEPGCVTFGGTSGICGPFGSLSQIGSPAPGYGPFGSQSDYYGTLRRMCVRWLCRCYAGTGKRGQVDPATDEPLFTDPYDWYTVASTTEVGGPLVFEGTLTEKLESASSLWGGQTAPNGFDKLEHDHIFGSLGWDAAQGGTVCVVYAFVFYGESGNPSRGSLCLPEPRRSVTPIDLYHVTPCDRCSCQ